MSYWNHRVFREADGSFSLREAYYDDVSPLPHSYTDPLTLDRFEDPDEMRRDLELMLNAFSREPVDITAVREQDGTFGEQPPKDTGFGPLDSENAKEWSKAWGRWKERTGG